MQLPARILLMFIGVALCVSFPLRADDDPSATSKQSLKATHPNKKPLNTKGTSTTKAARKSPAQAKKEAERAKWLDRLKANGVEPWPEEETDEEHQAALKKSREMAEEVVSLFPGSRVQETQHFLFVSNIPPQQIGPYVASLDRMYDFMCTLYGVSRKHKVWLGGKAPIFAFLEKDEFDNFEERYFPEARQALKSLGSVYGLSHLSKTGEVTIACYRGNDPNDFG